MKKRKNQGMVDPCWVVWQELDGLLPPRVEKSRGTRDYPEYVPPGRDTVRALPHQQLTRARCPAERWDTLSCLDGGLRGRFS